MEQRTSCLPQDVRRVVVRPWLCRGDRRRLCFGVDRLPGRFVARRDGGASGAAYGRRGEQLVERAGGDGAYVRAARVAKMSALGWIDDSSAPRQAVQRSVPLN